MSAAPSALRGEGSRAAGSELRPSGGIKECGRNTPREAVEGLEGGFTAGFPPSAWHGAALWSREALEALPVAASGEQPLGSRAGH